MMKNKTIDVVDELPEDIDTQMGNDLVAYLYRPYFNMEEVYLHQSSVYPLSYK